MIPDPPCSLTEPWPKRFGEHPNEAEGLIIDDLDKFCSSLLQCPTHQGYGVRARSTPHL